MSERSRRLRPWGRELIATRQKASFAEPDSEKFLTTLKGLEDRFGPGRKAVLEGGERESDGAFARTFESIDLPISDLTGATAS